MIDRYLELGLRLGRHIDGMVDAYFGPPEIKARTDAEPVVEPRKLADDARRLLADVEASDLEPARRHYLLAQVRGLRTTAQKLAGEAIGYADEVERCYGVRPQHVPEDVFAEAHARLDAALPGSGSLADRLNAWRESQVVPPEKLHDAVHSLADELRERTRALEERWERVRDNLRTLAAFAEEALEQDAKPARGLDEELAERPRSVAQRRRGER